MITLGFESMIVIGSWNEAFDQDLTISLRWSKNACKPGGALRPLTAAARVRIPYGPSKYLQNDYMCCLVWQLPRAVSEAFPIK